MADQPAAGWYPDPNNPGQRRYWDGAKWTEHTDRQAQPAQAAQPAQPAQAAQPAQPTQAAQPAQPAQAPQAAQPVQAPQAAPASPQAPPSPPGQVPPGGWQQAPPLRQPWTGAPLAGWGSRVAAALIDGLIVAIPFIIGIALLVGGKAIGLFFYFLGMVAAFFYYTLTMSRGGDRNGQTIGKQVIGIRVTRDVGQPFDFGTALLREFVVKYLLFGFIGGFFFGLPWLIDVLWPLWDDRNEALHDKIVKTHVVQA